jgi:tetratricopeptide (TPR) repeat protein
MKTKKDAQQPPDAIVTGSGAIASGAGVAAGQGGAAAGEGGIALVVSGRVGTVNLSTAAPADPAAALNAPYAALPSDISRQPNLLLRAFYGVVPFRAPSDHLGMLEAWSADDVVGKVALITGPGGSGKTRLAAELADRGRRSGWITGFLIPRPPAAGLAGIVKAPVRVVVVIDDAESRVPDVLDLVDLFAGHRPDRPWRIVLLSRSAGDWWEELPVALRDSPAEPFMGGATIHDLAPLVPALADRQDSFMEAARRFGEALGIEVGELSSPDLLSDRFGRPLFLQMAALSAVLAQGESPDPARQPVDFVGDALRRERAHWRATASASGLDLQDVELSRAVAVACLVDVAGEERAADALRAVPELAEESELRTRLQVARWLHDLYRADASGGWLPTLEPDLLAEAHVAAAFADSESLADRVLTDLPSDAAEKGLALLASAATDYPAAFRALDKTLRKRLDDLILPAIAVAQRGSDPLGQILAKALENDPRPDLVEAVNAALPDSTVALRELALVAAMSAYVRTRAGGVSIESTKLANNVGMRLGELGRDDEALPYADEAVAGYRWLATREPSLFGWDLAAALGNQSNRLKAVGRIQDALDACAVAAWVSRGMIDGSFPAYMRSRPGVVGFLRRVLRRGVSNGGEAPDDKEGHALDPDQLAADRAQLGNVLVSQASLLGDMDRHADALAAGEEALDIYRELARERPTSFLAGLAQTLGGVSTVYAQLRLYGQAIEVGMEAVERYRDLDVAQPDAFREDFAGTLNNISSILAEAGEHERALVLIQESATIVRELAAARPEAFGGTRIMTLSNLSNRLAETGRREEALGMAQSVVDDCRSLAGTRPQTYLPYLSGALNNLSAQLVALDRREEALPPGRESVAVLRRLVETEPKAFRSDLALALTGLSATLAELAYTEEAVATAEEMVAIQRELADGWPGGSSPDLAAGLFTLATVLGSSGRRADAVAHLREAVAGFRALNAAYPGEFDGQLEQTQAALDAMVSAGNT